VNAYFLSVMHQVFLFCFFDQAIAPDPYRQFIKRSIQAARQNCAIKSVYGCWGMPLWSNLGQRVCLFSSVIARLIARRLVLAMQQTYKQDGNIKKILIFQINFPRNTLSANQFLLFRISNLRSNLLTDHR